MKIALSFLIFITFSCQPNNDETITRITRLEEQVKQLSAELNAERAHRVTTLRLVDEMTTEIKSLKSNDGSGKTEAEKLADQFRRNNK